MKLIIDIPKDTYKNAMNGVFSIKDWHGAIKNGTPLPKGHGRLIDEDELKKIIQENDVLNMRGFNVRICDINKAPTIIDADKYEQADTEEGAIRNDKRESFNDGTKDS